MRPPTGPQHLSIQPGILSLIPHPKSVWFGKSAGGWGAPPMFFHWYHLFVRVGGTCRRSLYPAHMHWSHPPIGGWRYMYIIMRVGGKGNSLLSSCSKMANCWFFHCLVLLLTPASRREQKVHVARTMEPPWPAHDSPSPSRFMRTCCLALPSSPHTHPAEGPLLLTSFNHIKLHYNLMVVWASQTLCFYWPCLSTHFRPFALISAHVHNLA